MTRRGPQVDAGNFTRLHNDLLSLLALAPFGARDLKVLLAVIRLTYGFNRTWAALTLYDLVSATGLTPHAARATLLRLSEQRVLRLKGEPSGRNRLEVSLNKYAGTWAPGLLPPALTLHFGGTLNSDSRTLESHQTSHQIGDQTSDHDGESGTFFNQNGHQASHQIGDQTSDQSGENTPLEPAWGAGPGEPKDIKTERHKDTKTAAPPLHAPEGANDDGPEDAPEGAPYQRGPRPGWAELVRAFLAVYERGGAMLPHHKYRELEDLCDLLELPASEVAAHVQVWAAGFKQKGRPVPRVATPAYFVPVIQERLGRTAVAAPAAPAKDPYAAYTGGT